MKAVHVLVLVLGALGSCGAQCNPPNPPPNPQDAADGAPPPPLPADASTPCAAACATLVDLGCPVEPDCVTVYAHVEGAKAKRTPSGELLTCMMVIGAKSKADVVALGIGCP